MSDSEVSSNVDSTVRSHHSDADEADSLQRKPTNPDVFRPQPAIMDNLLRIFEDSETADVTLVVGGKRFAAHKVLLMASSDYFKNMFLGPWKEANETDVHLEETEPCQQAFGLFLGFFYGKDVNLAKESVVALLTLADKYGVQELTSICRLYMVGHLVVGEVESAIQWLPLAEKLNLDDLKDSCLRIICFNFEEAATLQSWQDEVTADQMAAMLDTDSLVIKDEYLVYDIVQKKLLQDANKTRMTRNARMLLPLVQFKNMTASDLVNVEKSTLAEALPQAVLKNPLAEAYRHLALEGASCKCQEGSSSASASTDKRDGEEKERMPHRTYTASLKISHFNEDRITNIDIDCRFREIHEQLWMLDIGDPTQYVIFMSKYERRFRHPSEAVLDAYLSIDAEFVLRDHRARVIQVHRFSRDQDVSMPRRRGDTFVDFPYSCWCGSDGRQSSYRYSCVLRCQCSVQIQNIMYSVSVN